MWDVEEYHVAEGLTVCPEHKNEKKKLECSRTCSDSQTLGLAFLCTSLPFSQFPHGGLLTPDSLGSGVQGKHGPWA